MSAARADVVIEAFGEGRDTLTTSVDYVLPDNVEIGSMSGSADISLTGNALANTITGTDHGDTLDGGAGADALIGGLGDDVYLVDDIGDTIAELAGEAT
mgnify:CR=1 FL=1